MSLEKCQESADPALAIADTGQRLGPPLVWTFSVRSHLAMRAQESDGWILAKAYHGDAKCFLMVFESDGWTLEMLWGASKLWSCGRGLAKAYPGAAKCFLDGPLKCSLPSLGAVMEAALPRPTMAPQSVFF